MRRIVVCFLMTMFELVRTFSVEKRSILNHKSNCFGLLSVAISNPAGFSYRLAIAIVQICIVSMAYFCFLKLLTVFDCVIKFSIYTDNSGARPTSQDI